MIVLSFDAPLARAPLGWTDEERAETTADHAARSLVGPLRPERRDRAGLVGDLRDRGLASMAEVHARHGAHPDRDPERSR